MEGHIVTDAGPGESPLGDAFHVYDTTLRDGAQREGISYSVAEKLAVAELLDSLGIGFIEGGWPGAIPTDTRFFAAAAAGELTLRHAQLVAFGATRRPDVTAAADPQVRALLSSGAPVVTLVAKSDRRHIERALRTDVAEACAMVGDTVGFLVGEGRRVFLDAEHFFDGYEHDSECALRVIGAAVEAGAQVAVLCDTNGGQLPMRLGEIVAEVLQRTGFRLGIHCQDDTACAVANTITAVSAGVTHVQCTANGYGERAGNADLFAVLGNLTTKLGLPVLPAGAESRLSTVAEAISRLANIAPDPHQPYVGASAFAHKAGLHASAIKVDPALYNHIDPRVVGNDMRVLVTEMAGRASLELKGRELGIDLAGRPALDSSVREVKRLEADGWSFERADASLELLLRRQVAADEERAAPELTPFELESYRVTIDHLPDGRTGSQATVTVRVDGSRHVATGTGDGPVHALDDALRRALTPRLPWLNSVRLTDYQVRILPGSGGAHAATRVLMTSDDGDGDWTTVGVHSSIVEASWLAFCDALAYKSVRLTRDVEAEVPSMR